MVRRCSGLYGCVGPSFSYPRRVSPPRPGFKAPRLKVRNALACDRSGLVALSIALNVEESVPKFFCFFFALA